MKAMDLSAGQGLICKNRLSNGLTVARCKSQLEHPLSGYRAQVL